MEGSSRGLFKKFHDTPKADLYSNRLSFEFIAKLLLAFFVTIIKVITSHTR